jgi:hypothetical protein
MALNATNYLRLSPLVLVVRVLGKTHAAETSLQDLTYGKIFRYRCMTIV